MKKFLLALAGLVLVSTADAAIRRVTPNWSEAEKNQFRQMFIRHIPEYEIKNVDSLVRETNFIECMLNYYSGLYRFDKIDRWNQDGEVMTIEEQNELTFAYIECHHANSNETSKGA